jgi:ribosome-binding protein aMBF1 (putative translation factor)
MSARVTVGENVAKKKTLSKDEPKQYGTLIRVSDEFADAIRQASSFEGMSMREFADAHLLPVTRKRYSDAVIKEARRIEGGEK